MVDAAGRTVASGIVADDGAGALATAGLVAGTYVVVAGEARGRVVVR